MTEAEQIAREPATNTHADMLRQWAGWIRDGASDLDVEDIDFEALTEAADEIDRLTARAAEARRAGREEGLVEAAMAVELEDLIMFSSGVSVATFAFAPKWRSGKDMAKTIRRLASSYHPDNP